MAKQVTNFREYAQNIGLQGSIPFRIITRPQVSVPLNSLAYVYALTIIPNNYGFCYIYTLKSTLPCTWSKSVVQLTNKS